MYVVESCTISGELGSVTHWDHTCHDPNPYIIRLICTIVPRSQFRNVIDDRSIVEAPAPPQISIAFYAGQGFSALAGLLSLEN